MEVTTVVPLLSSGVVQGSNCAGEVPQQSLNGVDDLDTEEEL